MTASLVQMLKAVQNMTLHAQRNPLDYARWTGPQLKYLRSTSRRRCLRMGNRGGKTFVALADVAWRARKKHPYRPDWNQRRGPQHQWIMGDSWSQLIPLMHVFRQMLGDQELASSPNFSEAKGWGKDSPCLVWPDGSTVRWRTMEQSTRAQAGAELDHILVDEPCGSSTYRELDRRLISRNGELSLALTPINAPEPLDWLRDLCTDNIVEDLHFPMTPELFTFSDGGLRTLPDGTPCDSAWIEEISRGVLPSWRDIVLHGGWDEIVVDGKFSESFSAAKHVSDFILSGTETLVLGLDHGTSAFTETAVLMAVDESAEYPKVYVVDCYEAPANSPPAEDAKAIVQMLQRRNVQWRQLKRVVGDIAHYGGRGKLNRKSNQEISYELAKVLNLARNVPLTPPIWTAKTGAGSNPRESVRRGQTWIHRALIRDGQFTIHPRCKSLIEGFPKYRGGSTDPHGHLIDALRYGLDHWINRGQQRIVAAPAVHFR